MEIELKDFYKISTNKIYAGMHWTKRKEIKDYYLTWFLSYKKAFKTQENKVDVCFDYYWKTTALDSDNCSYMSKMIIDCLTKNEIIKNDTIKYIGKVSNESHKSNRDYDHCTISLTLANW